MEMFIGCWNSRLDIVPELTEQEKQEIYGTNWKFLTNKNLNYGDLQDKINRQSCCIISINNVGSSKTCDKTGIN
jgi:hypothetical protein